MGVPNIQDELKDQQQTYSEAWSQIIMSLDFR
ncbi:hypothetical protein BH23VER1_BH23VER1_11630 [soil metagenome]